MPVMHWGLSLVCDGAGHEAGVEGPGMLMPPPSCEVYYLLLPVWSPHAMQERTTRQKKKRKRNGVVRGGHDDV